MSEQVEISEKQIEIMKHAVGLDNRDSQREYYRNRYIVGQKSETVPLLDDLEFKGYMDSEVLHSSVFAGVQYVYRLNEKGFKFIQQFNNYKPSRGYVVEGD